jgi:uncharacterized coiled-coil DUF342 family protein
MTQQEINAKIAHLSDYARQLAKELDDILNEIKELNNQSKEKE